MLWKYKQNSFVGGMLGKGLFGRQDLDKYFKGASVIENFCIRRQGYVTKRRGTKLLADITQEMSIADVQAIRLFPFAYENDGGYVLVFAENSAGKSVCAVFDRVGKKCATMDIPYSGTDYSSIGYAQSGDTLYIAHKNYPFARIVRYAYNDWKYSEVDFETLGNASVPAKPEIDTVSPAGFTGEGPSNTVSYCVAGVKDGIEGYPSDPVTASYSTPWSEGATMSVNIKPQDPAPDMYNVYKKTASGSWGIIGTTGLGATSSASGANKNIKILPAITTSEVGQQLQNRSESFAYREGSTYMRSDKLSASGYGSYGWVFTDGSMSVQYGGDGVYIGSFHLGLGKMQYVAAFGTEYDARYYLQHVPCKAKYLKAVVTFTDDTTKEILVAAPAAARDEIYDNTVTGDPYDGSTGTAITNRCAELAPNATCEFVIFAQGSLEVKNTKSIVITGYNDSECTEVATGSVSYNSNSGYLDISGNPFVINCAWATAYEIVSGTGYTFIDTYVTPDASITPPKFGEFFHQSGKYPSCVAMYQQRLALASTDEEPFTVWMSCVGDLYNFNTHDSIREDDSLKITLPATKFPEINQMILNRDLLLFCDNGEWVVAPVSGNTLSYKTISTKVQSQIGCSKLLVPLVVGDDIIFANITNESLTAIKYSYAIDGYESRDLSVLAQDIFRGNPITSMAYQQNPDSVIVCTLGDGTVATLSYMKEHDVMAWAVNRLGGGMRAVEVVTDSAISFGTTNVFMLAKASDGHYKLLCNLPEKPISKVEDAISMDAVQILSGAEIDFDALAADAHVIDLSDGRRVQSAEGLSDDRRYAVGFPFESRIVTVYPEPRGGNDTIQMEIKNATECEIRVEEGSPFSVRPYRGDAATERLIDVGVDIDNGDIHLHDRDVLTLVGGYNNRDGRIEIIHRGVFPISIMSVATTYQIEIANDQRTGGGEND